MENITFSEYQKLSRSSAIYPDLGSNLVYPTLGLNGEAGEVAEKIKKIIRDSSGEASQENIEAIAHELGDVLWYLAQLASELGLDLGEIASDNIAKLADRRDRSVISGSGDNR